ncbi:MAG: hypothetical protein Q7S48_01820 [bacterium]|nr:hypothetical protein [bacterium]
MSRRTKIIIAAAFIILIGVLLLLWFRSRSSVSIPESVQGSISSPPSAPELTGIPPIPLSSANVSASSGEAASAPRAGIEAFTRSFVERYGSYSNQSNFENIENLYSFMTESMQDSAQAQVDQQRSKQKGTEQYAGVTTRVVSTRIVSEAASAAELTVKTQRTESGGGLKNSRVYYQDITVSLISEGGVWKVNKAIWGL